MNPKEETPGEAPESDVIPEDPPYGDEAFREDQQTILGYLNFSTGATDAKFLSALNRVFVHAAASVPAADVRLQGSDGPGHDWKPALASLKTRLEELEKTEPAFANAEQSRTLLRVVAEQIIPGYLDFHRDLLFHRQPAEVMNAFMIGRICEVALRLHNEGVEGEQLVERVIHELNDFLGHRPVAVLESQKIEPRPHERIRPIPLYIQDAGVVAGEHAELIAKAVELLRGTDPELLRAAHFDFDALEELAIDPRAYDFDHPVNRRPNYHFGEWDPHRIDNQGRYRRFVMREVTLRALQERIAKERRLPREELLFEAAAVLAGTMLMASGISGSGPGAHDSNTTLATLIPGIAAYRDQFYEQLIGRMADAHGDRLREEAKVQRQPFGSARQHLNMHLARQRAKQLEHVRLAKVFARMGYLGAAQRQADAVPVTSARMLCRIDCALSACRQAMVRDDRSAGLKQLQRIGDILHRGIDCGAIVDPWNILGFQGNFSLFPAIENAIHDHRIGELIELMDRVFDVHARLWSDAAAADDHEVATAVRAHFQALAEWWMQFAAHEVLSGACSSALDEFEAAGEVANAFNQWHRDGARTGDVRFWAPHVDSFCAPKAYALVIETLLGRDDQISAMSLLIHWLSRSEEVSLEEGECSFNRIQQQWMRSVISRDLRDVDEADALAESSGALSEESWKLIRKYFDFLEANAEEYWHVPQYSIGSEPDESPLGDPFRADLDEEEEEDEEEEDSESDLFSAAYEDVVFRDSTDDGMEGSIFDTDDTTHAERESESERIVDRLAFLGSRARLWTMVAAAVSVSFRTASDAVDQWRGLAEDALKEWQSQAREARLALLKLVDEISRDPLSRLNISHDAMIDYDRRRLLKETLIEQVLITCIENSEAERFLLAALIAAGHEPPGNGYGDDPIEADLHAAAQVLAAVLAEDVEQTRERFELLLETLPSKRVLYVPLSKGGDPREIAQARIRQRILENLMVALPRLGLIRQTIELISCARQMERNLPTGPGAVTQFDELFEDGFRELVRALARATAASSARSLEDQDQDADSILVSFLERLTEAALAHWLRHSRTLRLSALEKVRRPNAWKPLVEFIKGNGQDLFTQKFLILGNIRAILHSGVINWLEELDEDDFDAPRTLIASLDEGLDLDVAAEHLTLVLEAIVENYDEYRDYNGTTTQSDNGQHLYMLLDFLRLRVSYDRVAWNLRPVVVAHEVLVRRGRNEAAQLWRRMLADRISVEANRYDKKLTRLQRKYAMRMASVSERIGERFLRPMTIDRMRALVRPAMEAVGSPGPHHAFEILEDEAELLMRNPEGSGVDVPGWLLGLEEEVDQIQGRHVSEELDPNPYVFLHPRVLTLSDIENQLRELS